tara:strand:- start:525 stop:761 length:237 start_codon:yes stop_codon:yes gene_type:complete
MLAFDKEFFQWGFEMDESDFEGTVVLEKLAEIDKLDEFFAAIDSDDFKAASKLMKLARIDLQTVEIVIQKMKESDHKH